MRHSPPKKTHGFLLIVIGVMLVVFVGLASAFLVATSRSASDVGMHAQAIPQANGIAETGLQEATRVFALSAIAYPPTMSTRPSCGSLSLSNNFSTGLSTVIEQSGITNPNDNSAILMTSIAAPPSTPTSIVVNNTAVFTSSGGRVLIGREVFKYTHVVNATTLGGVIRSQDGSIGQSHTGGASNGARVSQYQCTVESTGTSPDNTTASFAIRSLLQGLQQPALFVAGNSGTILRWNGATAATELAWFSQSPGTYNFNGISALNYQDAWAVADRASGSNYAFSRLVGGTWNNVTVNLGNARDLYGVFATSENEAWAVGILGQGNTFTILQWTKNATNTNNNWCKLPCNSKTVSTSGTSNAQRELFGIQTLDTNNDGLANLGYAVGGQDGTNNGANPASKGIVMQYNGTQWSELSSIPGTAIGRLYGVSMTPNSSSEVFFVGRTTYTGSQTVNGLGVILRLRTPSSYTTYFTTQIMRAVSVIDTDNDGFANFGCAVGDNGLVFTFTDANADANTISGNPDLTGVQVISPTDIWAVGTNGARYHYDGSSWDSYTTGFTTSNNLNAISGVAPQNSSVSSWYEVIN